MGIDSVKTQYFHFLEVINEFWAGILGYDNLTCREGRDISRLI